MANEKRLIMTERDAIVAAEQELSVCRYIAECTRNPGMLAIHRKRCEWLSVVIRLAKKAIKGNAVEVVHAEWLDGGAVRNGKEVYKSIDCSHCEEIFKIETEDREYWKNRFKVCPFCGAIMDGGSEDE